MAPMETAGAGIHPSLAPQGVFFPDNESMSALPMVPVCGDMPMQQQQVRESHPRRHPFSL